MLSGPDLARLMHVGTRVVRGADWKWGDQVIMKFGFLIKMVRQNVERLYVERLNAED